MRISETAVRGGVVNLLSILVAVFLFRTIDFGDSSQTFEAGWALLIVILVLIEPLIVYLKMDAVLGRSRPDKGRFRSFLFNPFTLPIWWGGRFALYSILFVSALETFSPSGSVSKGMVLPLILFGALREGFIVWCYTRTRARFKVSPGKEWILDLGYILLLALAETFAVGIVRVASPDKTEFPESLIWIFIQGMFFLMFLLPLRFPYTLEEFYSLRTRNDIVFLAITILLCFLGIVLIAP